MIEITSDRTIKELKADDDGVSLELSEADDG